MKEEWAYQDGRYTQHRGFRQDYFTSRPCERKTPLRHKCLLKIRFRYCFPHAMRQVAINYLPYKVDGPDDVMDNGQYDGVIVMPAYQHGIDAQHKVDNTAVPVSHEKCFREMRH